MNNNDTITTMPHSVGAEKAILSVLMQYPDMWHDCLDFTNEWLYLPQNRLLHVIMAKQVELVGAVEFAKWVIVAVPCPWELA